MRKARVPLLVAAALALGLAVVGLMPVVQTALVRHLLRRELDPAVEVGTARIAWDGRVRLSELRLKAPEIHWLVADAEVHVRWASLFREGSPVLEAIRLRGCVLEPSPAAGAATGWPRQVLAGLAGLRPPARLEVEGEIRLPEEAGVVGFRAEGDGLGAGGDGAWRIEFLLRPATKVLPTIAGRIRVVLPAGAVPGPLRAELEARAQGEGWPGDLTLAGELTERTAAGGGWSIVARANDREVARLRGTWPESGAAWQVQWWADFRADEVARFFPQPTWTGERLVGEGELRWLPDSGLVAVQGRAEIELGSAWRSHPGVAQLGLTGGDAEFELRAGERVWAFERLDLRLRAGGAAPVLRLTARQPWAADWRARSFQARDPEADLIAVELLDFPLRLPQIDGLAVGGGPVRGRLIGRASSGGLTLRTEGSLQATDVFVGSGERRWAEQLALSLQGSLRLAPEGWSAEADELRLSGSDGEFAVFEAKGGRLAGDGEAWKVAGRGRVQLAPAAASFAAGRGLDLTAGVLEVDAGATGGKVTALHAHVRTSGVRAKEQLPDVRLDARIDREPSGRFKFHVPLETGDGPNISRVLAAGVLEPVAGGGGRLELELTGPRLDLGLWGRLAPWLSGDRGAAGNAAPWAGWAGTLVARIDELVAAGTSWRDTRVRLRFEDRLVEADQLEAVFGEGASFRASGTLRHEAVGSGPFSLQSAVVLRDWSPAGAAAESGWFSGKLDLAGSLRSRAADGEGLWAALEGEVHLVSRGGMLRLFPVQLPPAPAGSGRVAELLAAAGGALESLGVRREPPLSRPRSVAELASTLHPLAFDQLSMVVARDAAGHLSLRHVVVLTPELRLTGGGNLLRRPEAGFLGGNLALELQLRARGRSADLLRGLGALDEVPDEWGYAATGLPLRVRGTLARPDASDLDVRLAALALERNPVSERAADWFNRIRRTK